MTRVLGLFYSNPIEGKANSDLYTISEVMRQFKIEHVFLCKLMPGNETNPKPTNFGCIFPTTRSFPLQIPFILLRILRQAAVFRPNAIFSSSDVVLPFSYCVSKIFGLPIIVYAREVTEELETRRDRPILNRALGWGGLWLRDKILPRCLVVECQTQILSAYLRQRNPDIRCEALPTGVDVEFFIGSDSVQQENPKNALEVLYSGSMSNERPLSNLLGAFSELVNCKKWNLRLLILGHGPTKADIVERARALKIEKNIVVMPWLTRLQVANVIRRVDICVEPYRREFPESYMTNLKVMEYMAASKVVVALADRDRETILSNGRGILYYEDTQRSLKGALLKGIEMSAEERKIMGKRAFEEVSQNRNSRKSAARLVRLILEACRKKDGPEGVENGLHAIV
jgi:glycosyltransferase involved in cell wall biosynthesis